MAIRILTGEEKYLIDNELSKLSDAEMFEGFSDTVYNSVSVFPIFSNQKTMVIHCDKIPVEERFLKLIPSVPDFTQLIVVPEVVDKRTKVYKALEKSGVIEVYDKVSKEMLSKLLVRLIADQGSRIRGSVMEHLIERSGYLLDTEVDLYQMNIWCKQLCFSAVDEITVEIVDGVVPASNHVKAFALAGLLLKGDGEGVMSLANSLLEEKEEPIGIFSLVLRTFRLGYKRSLYSELSDAAAAKKIGVPAFQLQQAKNIPSAKISRCMDIITESIAELKRGAVSRPIYFSALAEMIHELGGACYDE